MYISRISRTGCLSVRQYQHHKLLRGFYPHDKGRSYVYRTEKDRKGPVFYAVSDLLPEQKDGWEFLTREYRLHIYPGDRYAFTLRACIPRGKTNGSREQFCLDWLAHQGQRLGFNSDGARVTDERGVRFFLPGTPRRMVSFRVADFAGTLRVDNARPFASAVYRGIGKHKHHGCGLLMVKRTN